MLAIVNMEEIHGLLLQIPRLVQKLEDQQSDYCEAVIEWMKQLEHALASNRLPSGASIAALRGGVIAASRGITAGPPVSGSSRRKARDAAATDALRRAEEIVASAMRADQAQIADAERLARQLVAHGLRKRILDDEVLRRRQVEAIWQRLASDPELGSPASHLSALVGLPNALVLVGRALP